MRRPRARAWLTALLPLAVLALALLLPSLALPDDVAPTAPGTPQPSDPAALGSRYDAYIRALAGSGMMVSNTPCSDAQTLDLYYVYADHLRTLSAATAIGDELDALGLDIWNLADATTFRAERWTFTGENSELEYYALSCYSETDERQMNAFALLDAERLAPLQLSLYLQTEPAGLSSSSPQTAGADLPDFAYAWGVLLGGVEPQAVLEGSASLYARYPTVSGTAAFAFFFEPFESGFSLSIYPV